MQRKIYFNEKFDLLISNLLNGNYTDYIESVKKLSKKQLILFINYGHNYGYSLSDLKLSSIFNELMK